MDRNTFQALLGILGPWITRQSTQVSVFKRKGFSFRNLSASTRQFIPQHLNWKTNIYHAKCKFCVSQGWKQCLIRTILLSRVRSTMECNGEIFFRLQGGKTAPLTVWPVGPIFFIFSQWRHVSDVIWLLWEPKNQRWTRIVSCLSYDLWGWGDILWDDGWGCAPGHWNSYLISGTNPSS